MISICLMLSRAKKNVKFIHFLIRINDNSIRVEHKWKLIQRNQIRSDNIFECFKLYSVHNNGRKMMNEKIIISESDEDTWLLNKKPPDQIPYSVWKVWKKFFTLIFYFTKRTFYKRKGQLKGDFNFFFFFYYLYWAMNHNSFRIWWFNAMIHWINKIKCCF